MSTVQGKCMNCSKVIKVNDEKDFGFCSFCGSTINVLQSISHLTEVVSATNDNVFNKVDIISSSDSHEPNDFQQSTSSTSSVNQNSTSIVSIIFGIIVIMSAFINLKYTMILSTKSVEILGQELINQRYIIVNSQLGLIDGVLNGFLIFGKSFAEIFIDGALNYVKGFDYGIIGNALWLLFGWMWTFLVSFLVAIPKYFVTLYQAFLQSQDLLYRIGYVIATLITWVILKINNDES